RLHQVQNYNRLITRFSSDPIQARKDYIAFMQSDEASLFSDSLRQQQVALRQQEIHALEENRKWEQRKQHHDNWLLHGHKLTEDFLLQKAAGLEEYRHWLEHDLAAFTSLQGHPELSKPVQWRKDGAILTGQACLPSFGCISHRTIDGKESTQKNANDNIRWSIIYPDIIGKVCPEPENGESCEERFRIPFQARSGGSVIVDSDSVKIIEPDQPAGKSLSPLLELLDIAATLENQRRKELAKSLEDLAWLEAQEDVSGTVESPLLAALETLGRGEDPLTQGIEQAAESMVRISYQHFPQGTEQVLHALSHVDSAMDAVVEFIDDSTGNRGSALWQQLDETTQARILGAGKVLSVLVPVAKVKALAELARKTGAGTSLKYELAPYHGLKSNSVKSKAPVHGQSALDNSIQVSQNSPRRVGIDYQAKEFVIFDETSSGVFHGHVRTWEELRQQDQAVLRKHFGVSKKGKISYE
ncbi:MAG: hypothetical protein ACPG5T_06860, partial [Endozoicomonas sp.]